MCSHRRYSIKVCVDDNFCQQYLVEKALPDSPSHFTIACTKSCALMLSCWYKFKEYVIKEYFKLLWKWLVINFEVAHDTCPQIDIGLLQAFGKDDTVIGKVVEVLEQSQKWPSCSLPTYYFISIYFWPIFSTLLSYISTRHILTIQIFSFFHSIKFDLHQKKGYNYYIIVCHFLFTW